MIVTNLIPLLGNLFFGWSIGDIVLLYWCETAIIGFYSILKLPYALGWEAWIAMPFFIVHFGFFLGVAGFIALALYVAAEQPVDNAWETLISIRFELMIFIPMALLSHGVSFVTNFIGRKEYKWTNDTDVLMLAPYLRIGVMFGSIVLGAIVMVYTRAPAAVMSGFIVLKIVFDLIAHVREHRKPAAAH